MEGLAGLVPFAIIGVLFYLLILRPEQQKQRQHEELVASLAKDDQVVTSSGIHGRVSAVREETVDLEVGRGVHLTVDKNVVARRDAPTAAK